MELPWPGRRPETVAAEGLSFLTYYIIRDNWRVGATFGVGGAPG
jgi:hypothetical protein